MDWKDPRKSFFSPGTFLQPGESRQDNRCLCRPLFRSPKVSTTLTLDKEVEEEGGPFRVKFGGAFIVHVKPRDFGLGIFLRIR